MSHSLANPSSVLSVLVQEGFVPADLALLPLGTLAHALTNDDALRWLEAAGNALRPGGLLVLELAHPADVFDGALVEVLSYPVGSLILRSPFALPGECHLRPEEHFRAARGERPQLAFLAAQATANMMFGPLNG